MNSEKIDIIILKGAPGSGKSQTAKALTHYFPNGVKLEVDTLRQMVISVDWKNQEEHINMLEVSSKLTFEFLKLGFCPIIVVDTFSGGKIYKYLNDLYQLDKSLRVKLFGLHVTELELMKRLEKRPDGQFRDFSISKKLNWEILSLKHKTEYLIDTSAIFPEQTAEIIYDHIINHK